MRKKLTFTICTILLIALVSSGWVYNYIQSKNSAQTKELEILTTTFNQQYGTDGIKIDQMISSKKVYTAVWTDKDGATHVSWNVGGLWVTVWSGIIPETTTP